MSNVTDDSAPVLAIATASTEVASVSVLPRDGTTEAREREPRVGVGTGTLAVAWVLCVSMARLLTAARAPLGNGEAYYFTWSRFLAFSYYDHPPLVAWMVRLTTLFSVTPATARLGPVLASAAFGLLLYRLTERLYGGRAGLLALVMVTAMPVFLVSSFVINPEAPLAPLWVGFLLVAEGMRERDEGWRPLLAGALLGLAFLAKYTAVLLVPAALLYAASSTRARRWLSRPSLYAGGAVALALALPVILWNHAHGWPSLRLHFVERASAALPAAGENTVNQLMTDASSSSSPILSALARVGIGQLLSYSPLFAPILAVAAYRALRTVRRDDRSLFLACFGAPALFFLLAAMVLVKDSEQHWTMMASVPLVVSAGHELDRTWSENRILRALLLAGVAVGGLAFAAVNLHVHTTTLLRLLPAERYDARADVANELLGWNDLRARIAEEASRAPAPVVVASNHYSVCGRLFFETGDRPPVFCPTPRTTAFDFFARRDPPPGATVLALTSAIHPALPVDLRRYACEARPPVVIERAGRVVATYFLHACTARTAP